MENVEKKKISGLESNLNCIISSPKGNNRSPESNMPRSNLISKDI